MSPRVSDFDSHIGLLGNILSCWSVGEYTRLGNFFGSYIIKILHLNSSHKTSLLSYHWIPHVFFLHLHIMMQPRMIIGVVLKPNSSTPRRVSMTTYLPVFNWPYVCRIFRPYNSLATNVWWVSASPSFQGSPTFFIRVQQDAQVPPSFPKINTLSAWPFTTPLAITPTPVSETNFMLI